MLPKCRIEVATTLLSDLPVTAFVRSHDRPDRSWACRQGARQLRITTVKHYALAAKAYGGHGQTPPYRLAIAATDNEGRSQSPDRRDLEKRSRERKVHEITLLLLKL